MENPKPVHLTNTAEIQALGWAAESRDSDGHLMTTHAPFSTNKERDKYCAEEKARGHIVTVFAPKKRAAP
jgi:hypothetical protein